MPIQLRFDARQVQQDVGEIINNKIRGVTKNVPLYEELLEDFYNTIQPPGPIETGAFAEATGGEAGNGHIRRGYKTISRGHGIERDAIDINPNTGAEKSYYAQVMGRVYGISADEVDGPKLYSLLDSNVKQEFLELAARKITESMNEH